MSLKDDRFVPFGVQLALNFIHTRLAPYGCFLCQNKFATLDHCVAHVETAHSDWQQAGAKLGKLPDLRLDTSSVVSGVYESGPGSSLQSMNFESGASPWQTELLSSKEFCVQKVGGESPRSNRSWFADLEASFLVNLDFYFSWCWFFIFSKNY